MNAQRLLLLIGAIVLLIGLFGVATPVSVADGQGTNISCGNAVVQDTTAARAATERQLTNLPIIRDFVAHTDYVHECNSAVAQRRWWSIPIILVGAATLLGAFRLRGRTRAPAASA